MPHDHSALIAQFRESLTQQRYNSVVVHNYCCNADHFLQLLGAARDCYRGDDAGRGVELSALRGPTVSSASRLRTRGALAIHSEVRHPCAAAVRAEAVAT